MNREQLGKALDAMGPRDDYALPRRDFMEIFRPTNTDRTQAVLDKVIEFTDSNFTEFQNARNLCKQFIVHECIEHFVFYLKPEIKITVPIRGSIEVAEVTVESVRREQPYAVERIEGAHIIRQHYAYVDGEFKPC